MFIEHTTDTRRPRYGVSQTGTVLHHISGGRGRDAWSFCRCRVTEVDGDMLSRMREKMSECGQCSRVTGRPT